MRPDVMAEHHRVLFSLTFLISTGVQKRRPSWWIQDTRKRMKGPPLFSHRLTWCVLQLRYWRSSSLRIGDSYTRFVCPAKQNKKCVVYSHFKGPNFQARRKRRLMYSLFRFICFNRDTSIFDPSFQRVEQKRQEMENGWFPSSPKRNEEEEESYATEMENQTEAPGRFDAIAKERDGGLLFFLFLVGLLAYRQKKGDEAWLTNISRKRNHSDDTRLEFTTPNKGGGGMRRFSSEMKISTLGRNI